MNQCYPPATMRLGSKSRAENFRAVCVCAFLLATATLAQQPKIKQVHASSDHPVWRVDLQSQGYPADSADLQRRRGFANFDTTSFLSDGVVATTFVTREDIPALQRRDDPNHVRPYRLHAILLDASTGKVLHSLEWPIENPNAGIFPRADGGFLLLTTEIVASYSADGTQLKEVPLSDLHPMTATLGGISESPSYKSLVIQFINGNSAHCLNVHTDSLEFAPIACSVLDVFTASDNGIVAPEKLPAGKELREGSPTGAFIQYGVAMPDAPAESTVRVLNPNQARSAHTICSPCVGIPQFINNEMLAMYSPTYLSIVDRAGKVKFTQDYSPTDEWIDELGRPVRPSENGLRLAIASNKSNFQTGSSFPGGNVNSVQPNLNASGDEQRIANINAAARAAKTTAVHMSTGDIPAEFPLDVQVFDVNAAQCIYTLRINAEHLRQIWGLALSPIGNSLAIDSGGTIQVFALPPSTAAPK